ncbi:hypothetical protein Goari_019370, partial [Gossypium aridum]|nr:hypothetical protein [Gossypium aridum]
MEKKSSCTEIVIRDGWGQVVSSRAIINCHVLTGFGTEALACLQAVSLGVDLGFRVVILKGDALL